ncbi:choice-of-anchor K domain-containing protein [Kibdelosporangium lantanae]|uniref:Choice-of-anchor K domain-containing protein n=1 Tax=Kibdelosporangium lantanae TaxID=1497396 RepID=A0ABW3M656_9PSEU
MVNVLTSGAWTRVEPDEVSFFTGLGTSEIRWGDVPYDQKSGYSFEGHVTDLQLDGNDFLLGTFTHHNQPIPFTGDFALYLAVIVNFDDGSLQHPLPLLGFHHTETPNQGPHPDDIVDLPTVQEQDLVYVDNVEYRLVISGFLWQKQKVTQFDSPEGGSNSAGIFARMEATGRKGA